jgi:hypothetical protein
MTRWEEKVEKTRGGADNLLYRFFVNVMLPSRGLKWLNSKSAKQGQAQVPIIPYLAASQIGEPKGRIKINPTLAEAGTVERTDAVLMND